MNSDVLDEGISAGLKGFRVALVGGAGFIGHHVALALKAAGAEPHVVDGLQVNNIGHYSSTYTSDPNSERYISFINERLSLLREARIPIHVVDVRDYNLTSKTLANIEPVAIVHLAAVAHANRSNKDPFSTFDHSLRTLENVLDFARGTSTRVVYFSSSMVYGNFGSAAVTEDSICEPMGIYGALKFAAEKLVLAYGQVFDLPYSIIRPSALYGQRCVSRRVGQAFIENAIIGRALSINGSGEDSLDFTFIDDLVQGVLRVITRPEAINEIFNLTFGSARSINAMAEIVATQFDGVQVEHHPRDGLMPERGTLSIEKAKDLLDYRPSFALEEGLLKYIEWYKDLAVKSPELFR